MTSDRMVRSHLAQAKYRLAEVERARRDGPYAVAVRRSQEAVEPPQWHDVGDVLRANAARLPSALRTSLERLAQISADLRQDREAAFYGDEAAGLAPDDLYHEDDARQAAEAAAFVVDLVARAIPPPGTL
jgi:HEPN domain-containing protein